MPFIYALTPPYNSQLYACTSCLHLIRFAHLYLQPRRLPLLLLLLLHQTETLCWPQMDASFYPYHETFFSFGDGENGRCRAGTVVWPDEAVIFTPTTLVVMGLLLFVFRWWWWWWWWPWWWIGLHSSSLTVAVDVGVVALDTDLSNSSLLMRLGELTRIRSGERTGETAECVGVPAVVGGKWLGWAAIKPGWWRCSGGRDPALAPCGFGKCCGCGRMGKCCAANPAIGGEWFSMARWWAWWCCNWYGCGWWCWCGWWCGWWYGCGWRGLLLGVCGCWIALLGGVVLLLLILVAAAAADDDEGVPAEVALMGGEPSPSR